MNHDQSQGRWTHVKGRAKEIWGALTDDDITKAEGSVEKLAGVIQRKFGDTREAVAARLDKLLHEARK